MDEYTNNTTHQPDNVADDSPEDASPSHATTAMMWRVVSPVILVLGVAGSVLSLLVFRRLDRGSRSAANSYFSALAASDLVLLIVGLLRRWLMWLLDWDVRLAHEAACKLHVFLTYLSSMTSAWFLVAATLQRVASVLWPHRVRVWCSRGKSKLTLAFILLVLLALNAPLLLALTLIEEETHDGQNITGIPIACDVSAGTPWAYFFFNNIFVLLDLICTSIIPAILLFLGNGILGFTLARSVREARRMTSGSQADNQCRKKTVSSLTLTLVSLSTLYLLLSLPVCLLIALADTGVVDETRDPLIPPAEAVTNLLWYCNSALNFYVYALTGSKFRKQFFQMICTCRQKSTPDTQTHSTSQTTLSTV